MTPDERFANDLQRFLREASLRHLEVMVSELAKEITARGHAGGATLHTVARQLEAYRAQVGAHRLAGVRAVGAVE